MTTRDLGAAVAGVTSYLQHSRGALIAIWPDADDGTISDALQDQLLGRLRDGDVTHVIVDASYVTTIDLHEFKRLRQLLLMAETMGSRCMLCGVRAAVAAALVTLDAEVDDLETYASVDAAMDAMLEVSQALAPADEDEAAAAVVADEDIDQ